MQLSMKTDYALRALFTLVEGYGGGPIPIRELAARNDVPKRFLEHIMLDLMYEVPMKGNVKECRITKSVVSGARPALGMDDEALKIA